MDNSIVLLILPPHTSHLTQPLDVSVFGPLISTGVSRIQKVEWLSVFVQAHAQVFNAQNIVGGFRGAGIFSFDLSKVRGRIAHPSSTALPQTRQSTPSFDTSFNNSVLTSSPVDVNAVCIANIALNARCMSYGAV